MVKSKDDTELHLIGVMNDDVHVSNLRLETYWNGNLFNIQEHKQDADVGDQEVYD